MLKRRYLIAYSYALLFLSSLEYVNAKANTDLSKIGVITARKDYAVSGKGVIVSVEDEFKSEKDVSFKHGDIVADFVKRVAPSSKIIHSSREQTTNGASIINDSSGPSIYQLFSSGFYRYNFPQLKDKAVYTIAYGNDNHMPGTTPASRTLAEKLKEINLNSDGAVLFVGDMELNDLQNLTQYSFSAGTLASNYVIAPTSKVATQVAGTKDNMEFQREIGTSIAAPTVAGCLALMKEAFPQATGKQLAVLLLNTAEPIKHLSDKMVEKIRQATNLSVQNIRSLPPQAIFGRGIINVQKAIQKGKSISKNGVDLPSQIQNIKVPVSIIEKARYDVFADKIYKALRSQYTDPTIKSRVIGYILSSLPTHELINFPLYEDDDGVTIRPHAKRALKWIYEGIKERRVTEPSYQEKLSAIVLNYAYTLPQKDKEKVLSDELRHYGNRMSKELKLNFLKNLPNGKNIYLNDAKKEIREFLIKNSTYDNWGAAFTSSNLVDALNDLSEEEFAKITTEIDDENLISGDGWLNFIRAINDNPYLKEKHKLVQNIMKSINPQKFNPSNFKDLKKSVSNDIQEILKRK